MKENEKIMEAVSELSLPRDNGDLQFDVVYGANESRFTQSNYSEPLTAYTVGWRDPENLDTLLETLAPAVPVGRRFEFKKAINAEQFFSETDDVRAIGASFKRVEYNGETVNEKTHNKGLTIRLDKDEMMGEGEEETAISRLMERLNRNELRRGFSLLLAAATNTPKTWSSATNPDKDVRDRLRAGALASGIRPNRVLYAEDAWDARADAYELQNTPAGGYAANKTPAELAAKLMVDILMPIKAKYQSTASAKAQVQTALTVLMYYAASRISKDDPSNIKRFVTPTGNGKLRVFRHETDKFVDLSVEHYSNIVITSTLGIEKITVTPG